MSRIASLLLVLLIASPALAEDRILSLGGAVTETVFALHCGQALVGTDLTSRYPAPASDLPKVGYLRALGAEGVLSLRPELVLASADAGPPAVLGQIEAAGVRVLSLPEAHDPDAALRRVRLVGKALGREADAQTIAAALAADLAQVRADIAALADRLASAGARQPPRVLFLLSAGRGAPMAAGTHTAADAMIRMAGATNVITAIRGYRPISAEAAMLAEPDVIVTTTETLNGVGGVDALLAAAALARTPAGAARRVVAFDGLYLLGFGPRLAHAQRELALALHPGASIRPLPPRHWVDAP
jgi:iron complex transport system substrate-binding protein